MRSDRLLARILHAWARCAWRLPGRGGGCHPGAGGRHPVGYAVVAGNVNRERLPVVPAATPATAGQRTLYVRHPGDVVRLALGAVLVAACSMVAALESVSGVETGLFHAV